MSNNPTAEAYIKSKESLRLKAYQDQKGIWTCGWGTTGPDIGPNTVWTQEQAEARFLQKYLPTVESVRRWVMFQLTEGQEAALISFAYNCGQEALHQSECLTHVNKREWAAAARTLTNWDHLGQTENKGLLIRRCEEALMFLHATT